PTVPPLWYDIPSTRLQSPLAAVPTSKGSRLLPALDVAVISAFIVDYWRPIFGEIGHQAPHRPQCKDRSARDWADKLRQTRTHNPPPCSRTLNQCFASRHRGEGDPRTVCTSSKETLRAQVRTLLRSPGKIT